MIATGPQEGDQYRGLRGDAERRAQAEQQLLTCGERCACAGALEDDQVQQQHHDRHYVVGDRSPHHRPEPVARVEHLPGHDVYAVEEDLRHAVVGQHDHRLVLRGKLRGFPATRRVERHDRRHSECQQQRDQPERDQSCSHDAVGVRLAAVGVTPNRSHDLRHQDGVQDAAGEQDVHAVRHSRGDGEHLRLAGAVAEQVDQQHEPEDSPSTREVAVPPAISALAETNRRV